MAEEGAVVGAATSSVGVASAAVIGFLSAGRAER